MTPEQHHMMPDHHYKSMKMLIIAILALNLLLSIYVAFFKKDALRLETMKAGGTANMNMARQLYTSPVYIQQQKDTLNQILGSLNQAQQPIITTTGTTTETPVVAQ